MVLTRILVQGIRYGSRYLPKTVQALKRTDVRIHKSLYGAAGGRGVRHGRDIGSTIGGLYSGFNQGEDDLDAIQERLPSNPFKTSKFSKAYRGDKRKRFRCRPVRNKRYRNG